MLILDATTKSIEVLLGGIVASAQLPFMASYVDITASAFTPGENDSTTNNTTAVTMVAAPGASTYRQVKQLCVHNTDTASATVTVRLNNNGTFRTLCKVSLASGSMLYYMDGVGFYTLNSDGGYAQSIASMTSAQLAALISDETGSGALVFATSPSLTTPTINTAASVGGAWTAAATWTLPALTLGGTVTSNGQSFSGTINVANTFDPIGTNSGAAIASVGAYGGGITLSDTAESGLYVQDSGETLFLYVGKGVAENAAASRVMTLKGTGNVGIGTTTPLAKLAINGGLHVGGDSDPGDNNALIDGTLSVTGLITASAGISIPTGQNVTGAGTAQVTGFATVSATALTISGAASNAIGIAASATTNLALAAGVTGVSSLRVPHGVAPTSPVDGDIWTTTAGLFVRINGSTVGPLS